MKFRPWMVQTSYEYIKASRLLWTNNLPVPSLVTAAIGVEILFKSFLAEVDGLSGGIGEMYIFDKKVNGVKDGHNLLELFDAIPGDIKSVLGLEKHRSWISDFYQSPFVDGRYPYERLAIGSYTDVLTEIGEEIIDKVISAYKSNGCDDPWIMKYPDI